MTDAGRSLIADVAMGETPTHGKIKVNISKNLPKTPSLSRETSSSSYSAAAAVQAACKEASGTSGEGSGLDSVAGDGPLDESGRPGWSAGDSGKGGVSVSVDTSGKDGGGSDVDTAGSAVFKTVEWYGTIRLLVFARKGIPSYLWLRSCDLCARTSCTCKHTSQRLFVVCVPRLLLLRIVD